MNEYLPDAGCEGVLKALQESGKQTFCIVMHSRVPKIVNVARFIGLGAKDIICKHPYKHIIELVRELLVCDGNEILVA